MIGEAARDALVNQEWITWIGEAFGGPSGLGTAGVALFALFMGAVALLNWSETFKVPAVWLALTTPLVALALPVPVVMRLLGLVTTAVAMLFIGLWIYWRRM